jgi:hypothetical protein
MEVGQGPNWGCSAKEKKMVLLISEFDMLGHNNLIHINRLLGEPG